MRPIEQSGRFCPTHIKAVVRIAVLSGVTVFRAKRLNLLQQRHDALGLLVSLGEHGGGRLLQNLSFRQLRGGLGVVGVHDGAARLGHIGRNIGQIVGSVSQSVDRRAEVGASGIDRIERIVNGR